MPDALPAVARIPLPAVPLIDWLPTETLIVTLLPPAACRPLIAPDRLPVKGSLVLLPTLMVPFAPTVRFAPSPTVPVMVELKPWTRSTVPLPDEVATMPVLPLTMLSNVPTVTTPWPVELA